MKKTVLVIAYNEEKNIDKCLKSVSRQMPDELIVVCHNCTDRTMEIAKKYKLAKVIDYQVPKGIAYARIEGFKHVTHEIVACIDGDTQALPGWLKNITAPLIKDKGVAATGGLVLFLNSLSASIVGFSFFILGPLFKRDFKFYFWGMSFACRKSDYEAVGGLDELPEVKKKTGLYFWTDDLYLSLLLSMKGKVVPARRALVLAEAKEHPMPKGISRWEMNDKDRRKLFEYFGIDKKHM